MTLTVDDPNDQTHAWAAYNPAIEKTVEPSTAGVRPRIVSTDNRRRQDIRERLYG